MPKKIKSHKTLPHLRGMPESGKRSSAGCVSEAEWFAAVLALVRYLRGPDGCPWDRQQTAAVFAGFAREEASELIEALEQGDADSIAEEWGDTLFTLLAAAAAAETEGLFKVEDALRGAHEKLVRRHAHIFGGHKADTPEEVVDMWNAIKADEKTKRVKKPTK